MPEITSIILAAGKGVRMRSSLPKILHPVCGRAMIDYPLALAKSLRSKKVVVVAPPEGRGLVTEHLKPYSWAKVVVQKNPRGTAHAVSVCSPSLNGTRGNIVIFCGDTPLLQKEVIEEFLRHVFETDAALGFITTKMERPFGYGRVVRDGAGEIVKIVEEKEATPAEKNIKEINTGVYCVKADWLFPTLKKLKPHPITKEYYLTDIIEEALRQNQKTVGFLCDDADLFLGVNTQAQLAQANAIMCDQIVRNWMEKGVTFLDPRHVYLEPTVKIGEGTTIFPQVALRGKTTIGKNCVIDCGSVLKDMKVGDGSLIKPYCVLEESVIEKECQIGPFARMRPGSRVGPRCRVGNFVELKKTRMKEGVKANHLSYLGDAEIGSGTNIGCGTITCNYDGVKKYPTKIGKKVFVGSDVQFVAPVKIGDGAYIGAGSTITEDVPAKALGIARGRQVVKRGWVREKFKRQTSNFKTNPKPKIPKILV